MKTLVRDPLERFVESYVVSAAGCWEWQGRRDKDGYGRFFAEGRTWMAHRWIETQVRGDIGEGMHVDHLCKNTPCVNPNHLEVVTPKENILRSSCPSAINATKEACLRGHSLTDAYRTADGRRRCRTCAAADNRRQYLRRIGDAS